MRVIDFFDQGAILYPNNIAFQQDDERLTYADSQSLSKRIAAGIRGNGYGKGSKVGILAPNGNIAFLALLGIYRSESVWLPINPRNPVPINVDLFSRFDGDLLLYHSCFEAEAKAMQSQIESLREIVCIDDGLEAWMAEYGPDFDMGPEDPEDVFCIAPTGGTTGASKGVEILHRNIETMFANYWSHFSYYDNTRHLVVAPMTHAAGILGCAHFARGGANIILTQVDPVGILDAIQQHKITHLFLPPTLLYMMLAVPNVREYDYSSLQHFLVAAAPTSLAKLKEAIDIFGPVMTEAFGQTEAPAAITFKAPWDYMDADGNINEARLATTGRPGVMNQVAILDDEGNEMPRGESGEICVRGRLVSKGYYKNPEATAEIRKFGWHHTGDIGVMDEDGYVKIVDRKKDMIITGGFNVFPNEIEQVLSRHEAVLDSAVIAVPDEKWGEAIKAVVQLKPDVSVEADELIELCKSELGGVKAPKSVDFIKELPRSPNGKVMKTEVRKPYWEGRDRAVN